MMMRWVGDEKQYWLRFSTTENLAIETYLTLRVWRGDVVKIPSRDDLLVD